MPVSMRENAGLRKDASSCRAYRDEAVVRVDFQVAVAGKIHLVASTLDVLPSQTVGVFETALDLVLHGEGDVQRHGRDRLENERSKSSIPCSNAGPTRGG